MFNQYLEHVNNSKNIVPTTAQNPHKSIPSEMDDTHERPTMEKKQTDVEMDETKVTDQDTIDAAQLAMISRTQ